MTNTLVQRPAIRAVLIVVLLSCGIMLMRLVYKVRIEELGQNLEATADKTLALRSLGLIARFQLMQSRMRHGETIALLRKETSVSFAGSDALDFEKREGLPLAYELGLGIVNIVNRIAGARIVSGSRKSRAERLMETAYLFELQRNFAAAVPVYDRLLGEIHDSDLASFARLHRGYCLALSEQHARAAEDYRAVIASNHGGEYRLTAEVLLAYLEEFSAQSRRIAQMPVSAEKGNAYFNAGAYNSAIATLESLPPAKKTAQSAYLLGRSYEEIGNAEKALEKYRSLISARPESRYAKLSNRRIYAMGSIYASGRELVAESATNARQTLADNELISEQKRTQPLSAALTQKREELQIRIAEEKRADPEKAPAALQPGPQSEKAAPIANAPARLASAQPRAKKKPAPASAPVRSDLEPALTRGERKAIIEREGRIDELVLSDGNRLWGIIISEKAPHVTILTVMGKVSVDMQQISSRSKVKAVEAFRPR